MIRFFIRLLNYTLLVCFLGSLWGGWYLSKQGFGRKWRKKLSEEFGKRGVELTAKRITLDPLRGLVARNVRVFRDVSHQETIAEIDELRLDINYTRLLRKEPFIDALILSEAEVQLDLDPKRANSGEFTIHHLAAQLYFQPDKLEIRRLQGKGLGVFFSIAGVLEHRPNWRTAANSKNILEPLEIVPQEWLQALAETRFGKKQGQLNLRFRGNLSQKKWLQSASGNLEMPELQWRGLHFNKLSVSADFTDYFLTLRRFNWHDDLGPIVMSGDWRPGVQGHLLIDSRINAPAIFQQMKLFPSFTSVTKIRLQGDLSWTEAKKFDWQIVGKLNAQDLIYRSVKWEGAYSQFSIAPGRWLVRGVHLQQKDGALSGECLVDHGVVRAEITSTVSPRALWLSTAQDLPPWLDEFDFAVNPWLQLKIASLSDAPQSWQTDGEIVFGRTNFRGVALTSAQAKFSQLGPNLAISEVQITRPEGQATGEMFWDGKIGKLTLWDIKNSIDPVALGLWVDRSLANVMQTIQFPKGTLLEGEGSLDWKNDRLSRLLIRVRARDLAMLDLPIFSSLKKNLSSENAFFSLETAVSSDGQSLQIDPIAAENSDVRLNGRVLWNLSDQKLSGIMDYSNTLGGHSSWITQSPKGEVVWRKAPLAIPIK